MYIYLIFFMYLFIYRTHKSEKLGHLGMIP